MSICVPISMRISQYLDPQYFGKAWRNCMYMYMYMMTHTRIYHSPLRSEYTGREHTQETTLLWKVNTWKHGKDPSPCFTNYEEREVSMTASAFSSTRQQNGRKPRQWIPRTVNLFTGGHERNFESGIWLPLEVKCTSHEYEENGAKSTI
jgi:hypothetical protein